MTSGTTFLNEAAMNDRNAIYKLLKRSGDFGRKREVVAYFHTQPDADAAAVLANSGVVNPDRELYEVVTNF